jgi:uncharacterized protein (TIGR03437 family)
MKRTFTFLPLVLLAGLLPTGHAQPVQILTCNANATPPIVRAEGITERIGDIVLNCTGGMPGQTITGNFSVFLNVNITNRVSGSAVTGIVFTVDNGSGPQTVSTPGTLTNPSALIYNGFSFKLSSTGTAVLQIAGIRAAAIELNLVPNAPITAYLGFNSNLITLSNTELTVGNIQRGLYTGSSDNLICSQAGSALPSTVTFSSLLAAGTTFASTRVTEGFADAFQPKSGFSNLNADTGERIIIQYSNFPTGAQIYVPDVVAGSDAVQPTGGGDFGVPASGGQYKPSTGGSLLLARVPNADARGAGGVPVFTPGAPGSAAVSFSTVNPVTLTNGSGTLVYEVVDANPNVIETAQFPTFLGLAPGSISAPITTAANVFLAPLSTVETGTGTDPIPRFFAVPPLADCTIIGDCGADYFPGLYVDTNAVTITAQAGSTYQVGYVIIQNKGGGVLRWSTTVNYVSGSGWLTVSPASGINNGGFRLDATPGTLAPGTYQANVVVDGGSLAGQQTVVVTFVVTAAAATPAVALPTVSSVVNAASLAAGPLAPGSLATIYGTNFKGSNVSATFNGLPATILFSNATQINLLVPASLASAKSAQLVVSVDGNLSAEQKVTLASMAPAIFPGAVLNEDYSVNGATHPAAAGSVIQIFATGLSGSGAITATIGGQTVKSPYYAGPAPGLTGVQQVDLILPTSFTGNTVMVAVCGSVSGQAVCSTPVSVTVSQ